MVGDDASRVFGSTFTFTFTQTHAHKERNTLYDFVYTPHPWSGRPYFCFVFILLVILLIVGLFSLSFCCVSIIFFDDSVRKGGGNEFEG